MLYKILFIFPFLIAFLTLNQNAFATFHNYENFDHPLIDAVNTGNFALVEKLLITGNDVNSKGFLNSTALMRAAYKGNVRIVRLLLSYGANVNDRDLGGATALHFAARTNHKEIVDTLINAGAHTHLKDNLGVSPHERAKYTKNTEVMETLSNEIVVSNVVEVEKYSTSEKPLNSLVEIKLDNEPSLESVSDNLSQNEHIDEEKVVTSNISVNKEEMIEAQTIPTVEENSVDNLSSDEQNSTFNELKISVAKKVDEEYIKNLENFIDNVQENTPSKKQYENKIQIIINGFSDIEEALNGWDLIAQSKYFKDARITFSANGGFSESELFIEIGFFNDKLNAIAACLKVSKLIPNINCKLTEN